MTTEKKQVTFYTAAYSPYSHRVQFALDEANATYKKHLFTQFGVKPEWYKQVNPLANVPSIAYGGPDVSPDQPSPDSVKLTESLALIEFIADLYPEAGLLPSDPVQRANARAFIAVYENYVQVPFRATFFQGQPADGLLQAIEQFSLANSAVTPFFVRMWLFLNNGIGKYTAEDGQKLRDALTSEKFARFKWYLDDIQERPGFRKSWDDHPALRGKPPPGQ
ncbi:thioredoxin-like protein [Fomes fomentarius]|nr:thioredoxin-like protein [Fomes fomentarius]